MYNIFYLGIITVKLFFFIIELKLSKHISTLIIFFLGYEAASTSQNIMQSINQSRMPLPRWNTHTSDSPQHWIAKITTVRKSSLLGTFSIHNGQESTTKSSRHSKGKCIDVEISKIPFSGSFYQDSGLLSRKHECIEGTIIPHVLSSFAIGENWIYTINEVVYPQSRWNNPIVLRVLFTDR